jgi:hypothetical protein
MVTRTFAYMLDAIKQHHSGLLTDAELIFALQCTDAQIHCLKQALNLPYAVAIKTVLSDWDKHVDNLTMREEHHELLPKET